MVFKAASHNRISVIENVTQYSSECQPLDKFVTTLPLPSLVPVKTPSERSTVTLERFPWFGGGG